MLYNKGSETTNKHEHYELAIEFEQKTKYFILSLVCERGDCSREPVACFVEV